MIIAIMAMAAFANVAMLEVTLQQIRQPKQQLKRSKAQAINKLRLKPDQQWSFLAFCWPSWPYLCHRKGHLQP